MNIEEIMSKPVLTCTVQETLDVAARKMWEGDCGVLPVVGADGTIVGVITDRDICMSAWTRGRALPTIRVDEAMSKQVFTLRSGQDASVAEALMAEKQVRRVPIVDANNRPIGLVSMNDIAREAASPRSKIEGGAISAIRTLAQICRPRKHEQAAA